MGRFTAIELGKSDAPTPHHTVKIGLQGYVTSNAGKAVSINGNDSAITNAGYMFGAAGGISIVADVGAPVTASRIINSGTIESTGDAIVKFGTEALTINNSGIIAGVKTAMLTFGVGAITFTNAGSVTGDIYFGFGNDVYDGRNGRIDGRIDANGGEDVVYGGVEANIIDGGADADRLYGGKGNDTYTVDTSSDRVYEKAGEGTDTVLTKSSFSLAAGQSIEVLKALDLFPVTLKGNELAQTISGTSGNDSLEGRGGLDKLTGGGGNDSFRFTSALTSANRVTITDFTNADLNDDKIRLDSDIFTALAIETLSSGAFKANTTGVAGDSTDRIVYETDTGKLFYDADGNKPGGVAGIHFATLSNKATLSNSDFSIF